MNELFFESPFMLGGFGLAIVVASLVGWIQTGQRAALWSAIGFCLATLLVVIVCQYVVTDREELEIVLFQTAADLENNKFDRIVALIHPSASSEVMRAKAELPNYKFNSAKITNVHEILIDKRRQPIRATAKINVYVEGSFHGRQAKVPRYVELTFYKSGDTWLVYHYTQDDLMTGFRNPAK